MDIKNYGYNFKYGYKKYGYENYGYTFKYVYKNINIILSRDIKQNINMECF